MSIKETKDGTIITIYVKPNSAKFSIERDVDEIVVHAIGEPEKGKVNKEIIKEASDFFGFNVEIVSGLTSRQKILFLRGATKKQIESALTK
jgi:uncharacterized protein (TIGR00251 family)